MLPDGAGCTVWGRGVSQGHSDAVRRVPGVLDARQYTVPIPEALEAARRGETLSARQLHRREVYVVAADGADRAAIERAIVTMPDYFAGYDTRVIFVSAEELARDHAAMPHGGAVLRAGKTGEHRQTVEYRLTLESNPAFTGSVLVACARAVARMARRGEVGCLDAVGTIRFGQKVAEKAPCGGIPVPGFPARCGKGEQVGKDCRGFAERNLGSAVFPQHPDFLEESAGFEKTDDEGGGLNRAETGLVSHAGSFAAISDTRRSLSSWASAFARSTAKPESTADAGNVPAPVTLCTNSAIECSPASLSETGMPNASATGGTAARSASAATRRLREAARMFRSQTGLHSGTDSRSQGKAFCASADVRARMDARPRTRSRRRANSSGDCARPPGSCQEHSGIPGCAMAHAKQR